MYTYFRIAMTMTDEDWCLTVKRFGFIKLKSFMPPHGKFAYLVQNRRLKTIAKIDKFGRFAFDFLGGCFCPLNCARCPLARSINLWELFWNYKLERLEPTGNCITLSKRKKTIYKYDFFYVRTVYHTPWEANYVPDMSPKNLMLIVLACLVKGKSNHT